MSTIVWGGIDLLASQGRTVKKEQDEPIIGQYPELARVTREILRWDSDNRIASRVAARMTGLSHTTITALAQGDRPKYENLVKFARGMKVDVNLLLRLAQYDIADPLSRIGPDVDLSQFDNIPVSPRPASAGMQLGPGDQDEEEPASVYLPDNARAIRVRGTCMEPYFDDGDLLFIKPQQEANNGQKVVAILDDDSVTCKFYREDDTGRYLESSNGKHVRIDAPNFRIIGVVVGIFYNL